MRASAGRPLPYSSRLYWVDEGHVRARLEPGQNPVNTSRNVVRINSPGFRGEGALTADFL
jgi:hypothetical protein